MIELHMEREFGTELSLLKEVNAFVEEFMGKAGVTEREFEIMLAVEEWYVNIVKHGFLGRNIGIVKLALDMTDGRLEVTVSDNGPEFDPLSIPEPEKPENVEEAKIGGLGIHFIRNLMNSVNYRRKGERNILTMIRTFPGSD